MLVCILTHRFVILTTSLKQPVPVTLVTHDVKDRIENTTPTPAASP